MGKCRYDVSEDCNNKGCLQCTLNKIKTEVEWLRLHKAQFLTSDNKVCIDSQEVLNVIDKYRGSKDVCND